MPDSCSRRVDLVPPSRRCPSNEQHREQHRHLPVLRRSADLCERCTALVTELRVRRQFGAARPTEQPRRGQSTTIPAGVHVSIVSLLVNDVRHIAVPSPAPASRPRWSAQAASRSLRLPRRRPQPRLALPCQQGAGGRRVPPVQGGGGRQARSTSIDECPGRSPGPAYPLDRRGRLRGSTGGIDAGIRRRCRLSRVPTVLASR